MLIGTLAASPASPAPSGAGAPAVPRSAHIDPPPPAAAADPAQLEQSVSAANAALRAFTDDIEFSVDPASGRTVVRVVDARTKELIRQIPSQEMLAIAQALDKLQGLLIKQRI